MATDFHLQIKEIPGESPDDKHKGEIEILSFSWGLSNAGTFSTGGGGGAGKANFNDISFQMNVNKASPLLFLACATGQHIKEAVLFVRKQGGKQQEYYQIKMSDLLVSSYQAGAGGETVSDSFSLNFTKIEFTYKPQKADGSLEGPVEKKYDIKANKSY